MAQPPLLENGGEWTRLSTIPFPPPVSQPPGHNQHEIYEPFAHSGWKNVFPIQDS